MTTPVEPQPATTPTPPQFYPVNLHPEFGYFCPRPAWRQRARAAGKAMIAGAVLGAIGVLALTPGAPSPTEVVSVAHSAVAPPRAQASASAPAAANAGAAIVTAAMPDIFATPCQTNVWPYLGSGCLAAPAVPWEPEPAEQQADSSEVVPAPPVRQSAPAARKVQKAKRERRQEQDMREPDPRSAYAARNADPRQRFDDRGGIFGTRTGWGGGFVGGGWSW